LLQLVFLNGQSLCCRLFVKIGDEHFMFLLWSSGSTGSDIWVSLCTFPASTSAVGLCVPVISSYEPCRLFSFSSGPDGRTDCLSSGIRSLWFAIIMFQLWLLVRSSTFDV
jgi:hypothetical protein